MVKGTLASELRTRFCPMRFTYSLMTGSCTMRAVCSTIMAYCLPILISVSVEYQSPNPRLPTLRLPMASTSSLLPLFTFGVVVPLSEVLLAGVAGVEESLPCTASVVCPEFAAGGGADGVWGPDWATAGMVKQKHSNHAMETETARAFIGDSDPERFPTLLNPHYATPCLDCGPRRSCAGPKALVRKGALSAVIICRILIVNSW